MYFCSSLNRYIGCHSKSCFKRALKLERSGTTVVGLLSSQPLAAQGLRINPRHSTVISPIAATHKFLQ